MLLETIYKMAETIYKMAETIHKTIIETFYTTIPCPIIFLATARIRFPRRQFVKNWIAKLGDCSARPLAKYSQTFLEPYHQNLMNARVWISMQYAVLVVPWLMSVGWWALTRPWVAIYYCQLQIATELLSRKLITGPWTLTMRCIYDCMIGDLFLYIPVILKGW